MCFSAPVTCALTALCVFVGAHPSFRGLKGNQEENRKFWAAPKNLLVLSRECGHEPGDYLKGNHQLDGFISLSDSISPSLLIAPIAIASWLLLLIGVRLHFTFPTCRTNKSNMTQPFCPSHKGAQGLPLEPRQPLAIGLGHPQVPGGLAWHGIGMGSGCVETPCSPQMPLLLWEKWLVEFKGIGTLPQDNSHLLLAQKRRRENQSKQNSEGVSRV